MFLKIIFKPWLSFYAIEVLTTTVFGSMLMPELDLRTLVYQLLISQLRDINLCPLPLVGVLFLVMVKFIITLKYERVCKNPVQHQIGAEIGIPKPSWQVLKRGE